MALQIVPATKASEFDTTHLYTVRNGIQICTNIFLETNEASLRTTFFFNLPLRVFSCVRSFQNSEYWRIAFDVAAFASLFWLGSRSAIVVDLASEVFDILYVKNWLPKKDSPLPPNLNPREVLGLSEAESSDKNEVQKRYNALSADLDKRIVSASRFPSVLKKFQEIRENVEKAFQMLNVEPVVLQE